MKLPKSSFCFLASAFVIIIPPAPAFAQSEISRKTERWATTTVGIQAETVRSSNNQIASMVTQSRRVSETASPDTPTETIEEVEVITYGYQLPDFNPDDLYTHQYHFGMFSETGSGSGTAYAGIDGYIEFELTRHEQESEKQVYLYSIDLESGDARVFININDLSVNQAVGILSAVSMNASMNSARYRQQANGFPLRPAGRFRIPPEIGNERRLELHGDYLTLDNIQEEIFRQTRCNSEQEDGRYYLESCR